jgi:hypothetical protein
MISAPLLLAALSAAAPVRADDSHPVFIWYRTSGECPDSEAFLSQLSAKVPAARIAAAGDPIDFVVTLGGLGTHSNGRLERETRQGTVAIREIESNDCSEVAGALALSLVLAIDPIEKPPPKPVVPLPSPKPADPRVDRAPPPKLASPWSVGAQVELATAIAPSVLPGGSVFVDFDRGWSARAGAFGMFGSVMTGVGDVQYRVLGGRLEACPLRIGSDTLSAKPCAAFDLGELRVEGGSKTGTADTGLWATAGVHGRLSWQATGALAFEAELGAFAPLTRYTLRTDDPAVEGYSTYVFGFFAGMGATARLP